MELSLKAKELIPKAKLVNFDTWSENYPQEVITLLKQADSQQRYLSDEDLDQIKLSLQNLTHQGEIARFLRDKATEIVTSAREEVLNKYPKITQEGGELYPPERAQACWRDFWHFLRCITYGIATGNDQFIHQEGLENMNLLYQELHVPLPAMVTGLEQLEIASLNQLNQEQMRPYFANLIEKMKRFN
jgi:hypothetical protein